MKVKLVDVITNGHEAETGTCELCFGTIWVDEPEYEYEVNGKNYLIQMYHWSWGDYFESGVDNVIKYAGWLNSQEFEEVEEDKLEEFLYNLVDKYNNK